MDLVQLGIKILMQILISPVVDFLFVMRLVMGITPSCDMMGIVGLIV